MMIQVSVFGTRFIVNFLIFAKTGDLPRWEGRAELGRGNPSRLREDVATWDEGKARGLIWG